MMTVAPCPDCGSKTLFRSKKGVSAGGGYSPNFLAGLGTWWGGATFDVIVCENCGLTRFLASQEARAKLATSGKWERV